MSISLQGKSHVHPSAHQRAWTKVRHALGGKRGLIGLGILAVGLGLAFNWRWLTAAGIAPLILSALPCVAMCALGLCMPKTGGRSCHTPSGEPSNPVRGTEFSGDVGTQNRPDDLPR